MMDLHFVGRIFTTHLVPLILAINLSKQIKNKHLDLNYAVVTLAIILATEATVLSRYIRLNTRSRSKLTLFTAILLTLTSIAAIIGFNCIRNNLGQSYKLPQIIENQTNNEGISVFQYHFFADIVPGLILLITTQLCSLTTEELLTRAKRNFSSGEAYIVAQLLSGAFVVWAFATYSRITDAGPFRIAITTEITLNLAVITFLILFVPSYLIFKSQSPVLRYTLFSLALSSSYLVIQNLILSTGSQLDPLTWLVDHIFSTYQRLSLFSLWLSTLTACCSFSLSWTKMVGRTNSLVRKVFHIAIGVVFISGYNQDIEFTTFAAGGMLIIFIMLEMIRAWQLKPIGPHLESVCNSLRGKWDNRYLTLSHIYLLIGIFLPVWLLPDNLGSHHKLYCSSGFISVCIGDTAAAIFGTFLGKTPVYANSDKTYEGILANIVSMLLVKFLWIGYTSFTIEFEFVIVSVLTALVEAITSNCDNLILPLAMILFLHVF